MLNIGSHIRVSSGFGGIWHHGIYVGRRRVIHLSAQDDDKSWRRKLASRVHQTSLENFCGDSATFQRILEVQLLYRRFEFPRGPDPIAVARAKTRLNAGAYRVASNNCEHFAFYCKTGKPFSAQAAQVKRVTRRSLDSFEDFARAALVVGAKAVQLAIGAVGHGETARHLERVNGYSYLVEEYRLPDISHGKKMRVP